MYEFKPRTTFGKWADQNNLSQQMLMNVTGINKNTMTQICNDSEYNPNIETKRKVISGLRKNNFDVEMADFW